ncbi:pyruvate oxidoreductase subunit gamma [Thermosipho melanesiensis]|uniref:Pyruvate/ketoisovalerate oxidoreductase, gamma subunit n=2 Tax=Thermosipho melanesiensis TaxID=46541 RepID=A6LNV6_THEM4|nr:2-oxoacid:acceptor oxidoreductase family protein [Thermosipho melanesiensis]ABR31607.1 pyruvate/ketoisovalerate oxidoreductase, gamma subunit [Thermosipho melanesiensis BI429]APT74638.1 pyruvate oxidoreductase subunit gamma [Thermosipho melanesiensis]OOC35342.1 pyruvate oxidoreductase subunit gamma [Thermosipho melanesiensis]OOC35559.1 pyruvate oxidoreductase subunit gamma [Thermosipho melanesiensis]OOC36596.1 pyruvate oxidoreductase subunit gamma [Thermosipho melanesiensis]
MEIQRPFSIRIAGIGGQGNLIAGLTLAKALVKAGKYVVQTQNYTAQVRGGPSYCDLLISSKPIDFPKATIFDLLIILHPSMIGQCKYVRNNGIIIIDDTYIKELPLDSFRMTKRKINIQASKLALEKLGNEMFANMIMLGVVVKATSIVKLEHLIDSIKENLNPKYVDKNIEAVKYGTTLTEKFYKPRIERKAKRTIGFE